MRRITVVLCSLFVTLSLFPLKAGAFNNVECMTLLKTGSCIGCDLTQAELAGDNLNGANVTNADLTGAVLTQTNLTGANLGGANLTGANVSSAILTGANFSLATWTDGTMCRNGSIGQCVKMPGIGAAAERDGTFVAVGYDLDTFSGVILTSADGSEWTRRTPGTAAFLNELRRVSRLEMCYAPFLNT